MMTHLHNSTAIAGSCFYAADAVSRGVSRQRVRRQRRHRPHQSRQARIPRLHAQGDRAAGFPDAPTTRGSARCNTVLGPDGALYIADFYNRIIGHYEVEARPPRPRLRARADLADRVHSDGRQVAKFDISQADATELIAKLERSEPDRPHARDERVERPRRRRRDRAAALLAVTKGTAFQKIHAPVGAVPPRSALADRHCCSRPRPTRTRPCASTRCAMLAETPAWSDAHHMLALDGSEGRRRARAALRRRRAWAASRTSRNVRPLLDACATA